MGRSAGLMRVRSVLFTPADRQEVLHKLGGRGADLVVIDCEDAISPHLKEQARRIAASVAPVLADQGIPVAVRVNAPSSMWFEDDIANALAPGVSAIVVPKVECLTELDRLDELLDRAGLGHLGVVAGIETALGVADARHLLAHRRVIGAYWGAEDFIADMGGRRTPSNTEVAYARGHVALAGRLAGIPVVDQAVTDYSDDARFMAEAAEACAMGYAGKLCVHPRQVALANDAFRPSPREVERARELLARYEEALAQGRGAITFDGQMVDEPVAAQARNLIARS